MINVKTRKDKLNVNITPKSGRILNIQVRKNNMFLTRRIIEEFPALLEDLNNESEEKERRILKWYFRQGLNKSLVPRIIKELCEKVKRGFYLSI